MLYDFDKKELFFDFLEIKTKADIYFLLQMLDRFEQHTLKCSSCRGAHNAFQVLQKLFIAATVILCASSGIPSEINLRLLMAGAAIVSAAVTYALHELKKNFEFVDYVHAEIDWAPATWDDLVLLM